MISTYNPQREVTDRKNNILTHNFKGISVMSRIAKRGNFNSSRQLQRCAESGAPRSVATRAFHGLTIDSARRRL